jgi:hypothetical protein
MIQLLTLPLNEYETLRISKMNWEMLPNYHRPITYDGRNRIGSIELFKVASPVIISFYWGPRSVLCDTSLAERWHSTGQLE